jgi:6-phosphofructokinase 1
VRVGLLTGGGDCPGLNAVIRAVVRVGSARHGHSHLGLRRGWKGLLERDPMPLDVDAVEDILALGGTILGSSRTNPFSREGGPAAALESLSALGLDALVAIGGEDTLGVASRLHVEHGVRVVGVPKTIDNDLSGTDYTFGFDTAVQIAVDAIDRLHTTAASHDRVLVVEVMGRHVGWIATHAAIAGAAHALVIPDHPAGVDSVVARIEARRRRGLTHAVVVVSEGVELETPAEPGEVDEFGHRRLATASVGETLAERIGQATGMDTRAVVLGHVQRGGTPTARDRILATRFGAHAAEMVAAGAFGRMVALRGDEVTDIALTDAVAELKGVPLERYRVAETLFD